MIDYSHDQQWEASLTAENELIKRIEKAFRHHRKSEGSAIYMFGRIMYAMQQVASDFRNDGLLDDFSLEHPSLEGEDELVFDEILGIHRCGEPEGCRELERKNRLKVALADVQRLLNEKTS